MDSTNIDKEQVTHRCKIRYINAYRELEISHEAVAWRQDAILQFGTNNCCLKDILVRFL